MEVQCYWTQTIKKPFFILSNIAMQKDVITSQAFLKKIAMPIVFHMPSAKSKIPMRRPPTTSWLSIVVELAGGGSPINGDAPSK